MVFPFARHASERGPGYPDGFPSRCNFSWSVIVPTDGTRLPIQDRELRYVPRFSCSSRTSSCLSVLRQLGCRNVKHNGGSRNYVLIRFRVARSGALPFSPDLAGRPERYCCSIILDNWALPVSPTCHPNGQGSVRCLAFRRTDPAFEPSLYQGQLPPSGNAIFQGRDKDLKTVPAIQSADCRDKMGAQIAANSRRFALNWEISVCAGLRGGPGRPATLQRYQRAGFSNHLKNDFCKQKGICHIIQPAHAQ